MTKTIRCLALMFGVLFSSILHAQSISSIFIPVNMEWRESPVTEGLQVAEDAELFIFNSNHTYAHISGVFHKSGVNGKITICAGCGFSSEKGTWRASGTSTISIRYRTAHRDVKTSRKPEWRRETWHLDEGISPVEAKKIQTSKIDLVPFGDLGNPEVLKSLLREGK